VSAAPPRPPTPGRRRSGLLPDSNWFSPHSKHHSRIADRGGWARPRRSGQRPSHTGIVRNVHLIALALSCAIPTEPDPAWGIEVLRQIRTEYALEGPPGYREALGEKPQPLFNWGVGVLMSAMNGAARIDPAWRKDLREFVEATRAYWNEAGPVAGYDVLPMPKPADRYYDDNAWMVLALVEASDILGDKKMLGYGEAALRYVLSGEDEKLGGGIYWRESEQKSKNTCSNAPAAAACLAVYAKTKNPTLLAKAKGFYAWTKKRLQDPSDSLYWDSISLDGKIDKTKWSYNTGLMIRTAAELGRWTKDEAYTREAKALAAASEKRWLVDGRLADEGKFAHLLLEAWTFVPDADRQTKARAALVWLWKHGRAENGWFSPRFDRAPEPGQRVFPLIDQASAARAFLVAR